MINNINISKNKNNVYIKEYIHEQNYTIKDGNNFRQNDCQSYQDINQNED